MNTGTCSCLAFYHTVLETRRTKTATRRRWQCNKCGQRWTEWKELPQRLKKGVDIVRH
jgi:transcriptional regulator NrdR family protein